MVAQALIKIHYVLFEKKDRLVNYHLGKLGGVTGILDKDDFTPIIQNSTF